MTGIKTYTLKKSAKVQNCHSFHYALVMVLKMTCVEEDEVNGIYLSTES